MADERLNLDPTALHRLAAILREANAEALGHEPNDIVHTAYVAGWNGACLALERLAEVRPQPPIRIKPMPKVVRG